MKWSSPGDVGRRERRRAFLHSGLFLLALVANSSHGQVLLTETTWGGTGADVATGVATVADGSAYLVGSTDSFAVDPFGQPATRIFIVKLFNGAVVWQRIWNGPTIVGVTDSSVAVAADGSVLSPGCDGGPHLGVRRHPSQIHLGPAT